MKGGQFYELNKAQKPRFPVMSKLPSLNVKKENLQFIAIDEKLSIYKIDGVSLLSVSELKAAITTSSSSTEDNKGNIEPTRINECFPQSLNIDLHEYAESLKDMAPTGDIFFVAMEHKEDYHDNFDSKMTFKEFMAIGITRDFFLQHCQRQKVTAVAGFVDEPDFWDYENKKPLRIITVEMDNAPCNQHVKLTMSKGRCANILRDVLKVSTVTFDHFNKDGSI